MRRRATRWISALVGILLGTLLWTLNKACRTAAHADELPPLTVEDEHEEQEGPLRVVVPARIAVPLPVCVNGLWVTVLWFTE